MTTMVKCRLGVALSLVAIAMPFTGTPANAAQSCHSGLHEYCVSTCAWDTLAQCYEQFTSCSGGGLVTNDACSAFGGIGCEEPTPMTLTCWWGGH
jgi:hypothetical protein